MPTIASTLNAAFFYTTERVGEALWRKQLFICRDAAAQQQRGAETPIGIYAATVVHTARQSACGLRDVLSRPQLDRHIGSAWDRGRTETPTPARPLPTSLRPGLTSTCGNATILPDTERYDLGHLHKAMALRLGGSDTAVLATHLPLFTLRMARHAVMGAFTGMGLAAGAMYGAGYAGLLAVHTQQLGCVPPVPAVFGG